MALLNYRDDQLEERNRHIWLLRCQGKTQQQIAAVVGLAQNTVSEILTAQTKQFAIEFVEQVEAEKHRQTAILIHLYDSVYLEWIKSQGDAVLPDDLTGEELGGDVLAPFRGGRPARSLGSGSTQTRQMFGDPRYIDQLRGILADIRKIWGMDAPKQIDATSGGKPFAIIGYEMLPIPAEDNEDAGVSG